MKKIMLLIFVTIQIFNRNLLGMEKNDKAPDFSSECLKKQDKSKNVCYLGSLLTYPWHFYAATGNIRQLKKIYDYEFLRTADSSDYIKNIINKQDEVGNVPLHYAILFGHVKTTQFLKDIGSDFTIKNMLSITPIELVIMMDNVDLKDKFIGIIAKTSNPQGYGNANGATIQYFAQIMTRIASDNGCHVDDIRFNFKGNISKKSLLEEAIERGDKEKVEFLIKLGARPFRYVSSGEDYLTCVGLTLKKISRSNTDEEKNLYGGILSLLAPKNV